MKRWYERFAEIDGGRVHDRASDFYQDEVYAFFLNCYHLKDWIKNDGNVGAAAAKVEEFISSNKELSLCADICNGIKHLKLISPRSGQNPQFGPRQFHIELGGQQQAISVKYSIDTTSGPSMPLKLQQSASRPGRTSSSQILMMKAMPKERTVTNTVCVTYFVCPNVSHFPSLEGKA